jgi:hypothetical protein
MIVGNFWDFKNFQKEVVGMLNSYKKLHTTKKNML